MIWNSKMALVNEAIRINPFGSDKFIWNDIGSMRDFNYSSKLASYPRYENISPDKLDIVLIEGFHNPNQLYFQHEVHLSGSIFGASREVFLQIVELFYKYFDLYLERGLFIGCDQQMLATCYKLHPELFNLVIPANDNTIDKTN
jgi:hypothetical protein